MSEPTSGQREHMLRAGLAALVVVLVLVLVALDRADDEETSPTAGTPTPTAPVDPGQSQPLDRSTPVPVPGPGQGQAEEGRRGGDRVPAPPEGLEALVCAEMSQPQDLVVLSFNMHRGHGGLERVAQAIARTRADIVLLQEVDRYVDLTGNVDQTAVLAERLRMHGVFGANIRRGGGTYGTAVLSEHEILEWRNIPLPNAGGLEQRGLLHAVIDVAGREVSLYNTHLQPGATALRTRQAATVARIVAKDPRPRILGGDLNSWPESRALGVLRGPLADTWPLVGVGPGGTGPRGGRIDYVMASGDFLARHSVVLRSVPSDHDAVRTELVLPAEECPTGE